MTKTPHLPADWAISKALQACRDSGTKYHTAESIKQYNTRPRNVANIFGHTILDFARHIEMYEEAPPPPIDPDILIARQAAKSCYPGCTEYHKNVDSGRYDVETQSLVGVALAAVKAVRKEHTKED